MLKLGAKLQHWLMCIACSETGAAFEPRSFGEETNALPVGQRSAQDQHMNISNHSQNKRFVRVCCNHMYLTREKEC